MIYPRFQRVASISYFELIENASSHIQSELRDGELNIGKGLHNHLSGRAFRRGVFLFGVFPLFIDPLRNLGGGAAALDAPGFLPDIPALVNGGLTTGLVQRFRLFCAAVVYFVPFGHSSLPLSLF